jgi:hypothetical protein
MKGWVKGWMMLNSYNRLSYRLDNRKFCVYTMQSVAQPVGQRGWPTGWTTDCIVYKGSAKAELTARRKNYEKLPLRSRFGLEMTSPIFHTIELLRFHVSVPLT